MKIATFSNGVTVPHTGNRHATAAWMITNRATGEVILIGLSADRTAADKSAKRHINTLHGRDAGLEYGDEFWHSYLEDWRDTPEEKSRKRQHNANRRTLMHSLVQFEIVDL